MIAALAAGPHWFTYPTFDPVAIHLGPVGIRWYGLTYLFGALLVYLQLQSARSRARTGMTVEQAQEFVVYAMIGVIIGGRALYLIADMLTPGGNPPSFYLQHPLEIIAIWHGGMAFHGGLIGAGGYFERGWARKALEIQLRWLARTNLGRGAVGGRRGRGRRFGAVGSAAEIG